jgi:hypothetical protein
VKGLLWSAYAAVALFTLALSGCVASGGYAYADGVGYYQAAGYDYGGWGPNYVVGPVREEDHHPDRDDHRSDHGGAPPVQHDDRGGAGARPVPSIPSGSRSGESHPH